MGRLSRQFTEQTGRLLYLAQRINAPILKAVISTLHIRDYDRKDSLHLQRHNITEKISSFIEDNVSYHQNLLQKPPTTINIFNCLSKLENNICQASYKWRIADEVCILETMGQIREDFEKKCAPGPGDSMRRNTTYIPGEGGEKINLQRQVAHGG